MTGRLYKFITDPKAVEFLLDGLLKFTPVRELNDPTELSPVLDLEAVRASLGRLRRDGYRDEDIADLQRQQRIFQVLAPGCQLIEAPRTVADANAVLRSPFYNQTEALEYAMDALARAVSSRVGIFCISRRCDSLPMWAHYAANATGLVVEFRDLSDAFPGDGTGVLGEVKMVKYRTDVSGITFEPGSHELLFLEKFKDWSYEEEARVVLPLAKCNAKCVGGRQVYLYRIAPKYVARIILGWNVSDEAKSLVFAARKQPCPPVVQARLVRGRVRIEEEVM